MPVLDILCLANSKKHGGRCVAGLRMDGKGWIRPVSFERSGTLFEKHFTLPDGSFARPLDVLRIRFATPRPEPHHPENVLLTHIPWELAARPAEENVIPILKEALVEGPVLLGNCENRLPFAQFALSPAESSLAVLIPDDFRWVIQHNRDGERRLRVRFTLKNVDYTLALTDLSWENRCALLAAGEHDKTKAGLQRDEVLLLTVSLSEPFKPTPASEEFCYKLVAAVTVVPQAWREALIARPVMPAVASPVASPIDASPKSEDFDWSWLEGASSAPPQKRQRKRVEKKQASKSVPAVTVTAGKKPFVETLAEIRSRYPRAYEKWTEAEERWLGMLVHAGHEVKAIATLLQRHPGGVRSRMQKLNIESEPGRVSR